MYTVHSRTEGKISPCYVKNWVNINLDNGADPQSIAEVLKCGDLAVFEFAKNSASVSFDACKKLAEWLDSDRKTPAVYKKAAKKSDWFEEDGEEWEGKYAVDWKLARFDFYSEGFQTFLTPEKFVRGVRLFKKISDKNSQEIARMIGVCDRTVENWSKGVFPNIRTGRLLLLCLRRHDVLRERRMKPRE